MSDGQENKAHKATRSGSKFKRKVTLQKERKGIDTQPNRGQNPKAFAGRSAGSHKTKKELRSVEKREHTLHLPHEDKTFSNVLDEPPLLVGVVGPPGSGKSTLIRSMAKFYSHRNIRNLRGPVTVVAGRYRRLTFMECPNNLSAMCDLAKVVDLVLLVIDGSYGLEMETFEFLSIAQVHGFPKVIGIVTHLDGLKSNKALRRRKNLLRHRFWAEVVAGAKMLTLAPMMHGMYRSSDVLKLHRLLVCVDTKPQAWRNTHSCVFVDRFEDLTNPDLISTSNRKCDRTVALYGYVRGHPLKPGQLVHVPGLGDYQIANLSYKEDPCEPVSHANAGKAPDGGNTKMRHLSQKHKKIYAPHCDVGNVTYDDDAVYVFDDPDRQFVVRSGKGWEMLQDLQRADGGLDKQFEAGEGQQRQRRPASFVDLDSDQIRDVGIEHDHQEDADSDSDADDAVPQKGLNLKDFAHIGADDEEYADEEEDADDDGALAPRAPFALETTRIRMPKLEAWGSEEEAAILSRVKRMFVTGWAEKDDGENEGQGEKRDVDSDMNPYGEKGYESLSDDGGDIADDSDRFLSGGKAPTATTDVQGQQVKEKVDSGLANDGELETLLEHFIGGAYKSTDLGALGDDFSLVAENTAPTAGAPQTDAATEYLRQKEEKKKEFDKAYDQGESHQKAFGGAHRPPAGAFIENLQKAAEERKKHMAETLQSFSDDIEKKVSLIGYFSGLYVRVVLEKVPAEFVERFSPLNPIIIGGLNAGEDQMGVVHMRLKRHRWYPRLLKAQDPVVFSVGWRRIQSQPIFATEDQNGRLRYLKYTPQHNHCVAAFYGPVTPPNAGVVCYPAENRRGDKAFRLSATGYTISSEASTMIVKKLKLTGVPQKIQKTTCFVKGMFNSDLEAAMFVGAKVKSVSGLRGMIKKAIKGKHGIVRCTFEDKLLASDIVFIRTWKPVQPPRYCATVQNLLDSEWKGMRPMAQLRRDYNQPLPARPDSEYKPVVRKVVAEEVSVPTTRALRMRLPFAEKEEFIPIAEPSKRDLAVKAATFVAPEPRELRAKALLSVLKEKAEQMEEQQSELKRLAKRKTQREEEKNEELYAQKLKKAKKETARKAEFRSLKKSRAHKK